jgi:hypothetical protein
MVKFPEQNARVLPKFPETSLQQRWRAKQTEALTSRRTWKSTQMAVTSICIPFKTYLVREFGEDYITSMMTEFETTQLGNSSSMNTAVNIILGPSTPEKPEALTAESPSQGQMAAYNLAMSQYAASVEVAKSYVGMKRPDSETANRIVTLVIKLMQYSQSAASAEAEAQLLAVESLVKGEVPSAALLRTVSQNNKGYDYNSTEAFAERFYNAPLNFSTYGINSDNPIQWDHNKVLLDILTPLFWQSEVANSDLFLGNWNSSNYNRKKFLAYWVMEWAMTEFGIINLKYASKPNGVIKEQYYTQFPTLNLLLTDVGKRTVTLSSGQRQTNVTAEQYQEGWFASEGNGFRDIGKMVLFYAKAYGKTADPLTFWSTHAKYRIVSRSMGGYGTYGELTQVDASVGAPSGNSVVVSVFKPQTPSGSIIVSLRQYFPYVMDVETGNNPKIDQYIQKTITDRQIQQAGSEFQQQPASSQAGYRFVAVTRTLLSYPGDVLYPMAQGESVVLDSPLAMWFSPESNYSKVSHAAGWRNSIANATIKRGYGGMMRSGSEAYYLDMKGSPYATEVNRPFSWTSATSGMNKDHRQIIYGLPTPHPNARIISTLQIVLVPTYIDTAIREVYATLQQKKGEILENSRKAGMPSSEWLAYSNAMIALTSGHWASEGEWLRSGSNALRADHEYNTMFSTMGIPVTNSYTIIDKYSDKYPKMDGVWELTEAMNVLSTHGLGNLSGLKTVYEEAINDTDDIAFIIKNFKQAFPGVQELVMPDVSEIEDLAPFQRPFNANVTSIGRGALAKIPGLAENQQATYIVRRVPISVKGTSGKTYRFGLKDSALSELTLVTNTPDMVMSNSASTGPILAATALGAGILGTYALMRSIVSR